MRGFCRLKPLILPAVAVAAAMTLQIGGVSIPVVGHGWAQFDPASLADRLAAHARAIDRSSPEGTRIFNDLDFGGFLIYHAPHLRVFVDDRCSLYGTDFLLSTERARRKGPGPNRPLAAAVRFRLCFGARAATPSINICRSPPTGARWGDHQRRRLYWHH